MKDQRARRGPWRMEIVEADPIRVEGRKLVPLVRVTSQLHRKASLCSNRVEGQGYGFIHMRPVAVLDKGVEGGPPQERLRIRDETARAIKWLILAALFVPCLATLLVHLSRGRE